MEQIAIGTSAGEIPDTDLYGGIHGTPRNLCRNVLEKDPEPQTP